MLIPVEFCVVFRDPDGSLSPLHRASDVELLSPESSPIHATSDSSHWPHGSPGQVLYAATFASHENLEPLASYYLGALGGNPTRYGLTVESSGRVLHVESSARFTEFVKGQDRGYHYDRSLVGGRRRKRGVEDVVLMHDWVPVRPPHPLYSTVVGTFTQSKRRSSRRVESSRVESAKPAKKGRNQRPNGSSAHFWRLLVVHGSSTSIRNKLGF